MIKKFKKKKQKGRTIYIKKLDPCAFHTQCCSRELMKN